MEDFERDGARRTYRYGDLVILRPVQLEEPHTITACFRNVFNTAARRCAENVRDTDLRRHLCDTQLFILMKYDLYADRSNEQRRLKLMAEKFCPQVSVSGRAEHTGDHLGVYCQECETYWLGRGRVYLPLSEGQAIGIHCRLLPGAASDIIEASSSQMRFGLSFELVRIGGDSWKSVLEQAISVDFLKNCELGSALVSAVRIAYRLESPVFSTTFWVVRMLLNSRHGYKSEDLVKA